MSVLVQAGGQALPPLLPPSPWVRSEGVRSLSQPGRNRWTNGRDRLGQLSLLPGVEGARGMERLEISLGSHRQDGLDLVFGLCSAVRHLVPSLAEGWLTGRPGSYLSLSANGRASCMSHPAPPTLVLGKVKAMSVWARPLQSDSAAAR